MVRHLADKSVVSGRDNASGFPLFLLPAGDESSVSRLQLNAALLRELGRLTPLAPEERSEIEAASRRLYPAVEYGRLPTFDPRFVERLCTQLSCGWAFEGFGGNGMIGPEGLLAILYATFYSPAYRVYFKEELIEGFPCICVPRTIALFARLAALGADLISFHLLEPTYPSASWNQGSERGPDPFLQRVSTFREEGERTIDRAGEKGKAIAPSPKGPGFGRVYINETAYFDGVPEAVWRFHIGGYQVCHKWLSDRKGRTLTDEDIAHYYKIVIALNETIRIMGEIDKVIEEHGGWPGAFVTDTKGESAS